MTLNELRYIVAVAQEKSFGRAAQRCFISQPALSVAIQKLEEELQTQLFERGKSEITVTPVGERIIEQAHKVLEEASQIRDIAQAGRNQLAGLFRLGAIYTVAPYLLPDLVPALNALAPDMPLEIEENITEQLEAALKTGRVDAAIIALPFAPSGIVTEFLYEEPFQVVVLQRHPWAKRKSIDPLELAGEHAILLNVGHCFRDQVLESCPELNRGDTPVTRSNSLETIRNMVASGLGISVRPRDALTPKYHSRLVVPVPFAKPVPSRRIALAYRKSFPRPGCHCRDSRRGQRMPAATTLQGAIGCLIKRLPTAPPGACACDPPTRLLLRESCMALGSQGQGRPHHRCIDGHRRRSCARVRAARQQGADPLQREQGRRRGWCRARD